GAVEHSAAVARRRAGLDRRRIRPATVGDQRGAADPPGGVLGLDWTAVLQPGWIRPFLHGVADRRALPDVQIRARGPVEPGHRPESGRTRPLHLVQGPRNIAIIDFFVSATLKPNRRASTVVHLVAFAV